MFVKSTMPAVCCAMLVLLLTSRTAARAATSSDRFVQGTKRRCAAINLPHSDPDVSRYSNTVESTPAGH